MPAVGHRTTRGVDQGRELKLGQTRGARLASRPLYGLLGCPNMRLPVVVCVLALAACTATTEDQRRQLIADSVESTVLLTTSRDNGGRRAGSGVILGRGIDDTVMIATTAHLLTPIIAQTVRVTVPHTGAEAEADIVALDERIDLAVLQAKLADLPAVTLKQTARLGDGVWVVGFPWGQRGTLVNGAVSQIALASDASGVVIDGAVRMIDAPVNYGTSGGGVFDARSGRLVGIVRGYRTVQMSVPGNTDASLTLPVAGETTVIPTEDILCFLAGHDLGRQLFDSAEIVGDCAAG